MTKRAMGIGGWWALTGLVTVAALLLVGAVAFAADAAVTAPGRVGQALALIRGEHRCIEIPHRPSLDLARDRSFTIEAWCRPENPAAGDYQFVYARYSPTVNLGLGICPDGRARCFVRDSAKSTVDCRGKRVLQANTWHHLAGVYDAGARVLRLFVDGKCEAERPWTLRGDLASSVPHHIGACGPPLNDYHFAGRIDEVRLSRTARDVAALWEQGVYARGLLPDTETVALWRLEGVDPVTDSSGQGNDGQVVVRAPGTRGGLGDPVVVLPSGLKPEEVEKRPYREYVRECLDLLMEHGTDRYGTVHAPILMNILDVRTRECPEDPLPLDEAVRVARRGRRGPAGANLYPDQTTLRAMYALSTVSGKRRYAEFADRCLDYYTKNLVDDKGFFWWGWHRHYDAYQEKMTGHNADPHEIHVQQAMWPELWRVNPEAVRREIEAIWQWHIINKETGECNRHGDGHRGCDFAMTGGELLYAFSFLYTKTDDRVWLERARLVADYYWKSRDSKTRLIPNRPNAGETRFDGSHFDTSIPGLHCHSLLAAFELTGEAAFRDYAVTYLKAYLKYGCDREAGQFWGSLKLDGTPVPEPRVTTGYAAQEPRGYIDLWQPYVAGYEHPLATAQTYAYAYQVTRDPELLEGAKRWAEVIRGAFPARACRTDTWYAGYSRNWAPHGTYADHYGRSLSFFLHLHALTGERAHLEAARQIAREAISKLYYRGLFRGHPCKPYYEAIDGVGYLLVALVQLDQALAGKEPVDCRNR